MKLDELKDLNPQQLKAVKTINGPLLIIAGAGSGKTRTLVYRLAWMIEKGIPQKSILALTFTNKAAREMWLRICKLTGKKLKGLTVSTFHSFGSKILKNCIHHLGYKNNFSIYDQVDKTALIKEVAGEMSFSPDSIDAYKVSSLFSKIKTGLIEWDHSNDQYRSLYREYQAHLKVYNAVDFDDLIILPIEIFGKYTDVLETYRNKYSYIMVDEFQDTSNCQYELIKLIAKGNNNICVVGDDDQSIYSWRGANYQNIMQFERDFPDVREIKLEQNYRSTKNILSVANRVIMHNRNRKEKSLWSGLDRGSLVEGHYPKNESDEGSFIARTIKSLHAREDIPFHEIGVLVRTNSLTRYIEEAFLEENIPYRISGGTSFFQRKEIKDIISYMRVMANPDDDINFLRIINRPRRGLGKKALETIRTIADSKGMSLYSAMSAIRYAYGSPLPEKIKHSLNEFLTLIEYYREKLLSNRNMADTLSSFIDSIDYQEYISLEHRSKPKLARYKIDNIKNFLRMLEDWEKDPDNMDPSLYNYLNRITLITRDDIDDNDETGKVNLMTIHSAKGLEFEVVFLAGAEDGIIPHARSLGDGEDNIEEERRLFYVAITRARKKLFISSCLKRRYMKGLMECSPSPFLSDIPDELISFFKGEEPVDSSEANDYFAALKEQFKR
ncbi:MAG: AAA family ATPase [Spirochaetes bacterium]|nr:MAG: AAA family ATPase [Spirochaetota bacterium]